MIEADFISDSPNRTSAPFFAALAKVLYKNELEPSFESRQSISIATRTQGAGADTNEELTVPMGVHIDGEGLSSELSDSDFPENTPGHLVSGDVADYPPQHNTRLLTTTSQLSAYTSAQLPALIPAGKQRSTNTWTASLKEAQRTVRLIIFLGLPLSLTAADVHYRCWTIVDALCEAGMLDRLPVLDS